MSQEFTYVGGSGQVESIITPAGLTTFSYQPGLTLRTDPRGYVHRYHYTGVDVTQTDLWFQNQAEYIHQYRFSNSRLVAHVLPRGNRVDFVWDPVGNLLQKRFRTTDTGVNDPSDIVQTWTYAANFQTSHQDPMGNTWTYGRDAVGNLTSVTHPTVTQPVPQTASSSTTYNGAGQVLTHTDEEALTTTYVYFTSGTSVGLLEKTQVGPPGSVIEHSVTYDTAGNVSTRTDPKGNTWATVLRERHVRARSERRHHDDHGGCRELRDGDPGAGAAKLPPAGALRREPQRGDGPRGERGSQRRPGHDDPVDRDDVWL